MSNRLPILAAEIRNAHSGARAAAKLSLENAIKAGDRLLEGKSLVKHGQWLDWLRENCDMSERTAQTYMRLAKHKGTVDLENRSVADLTIRAAVAEIVDPKLPDKISERVRLAQLLPAAGCLKVGLRETKAGWDEVWIASSFQHPGFYYVTHLWTALTGDATATGTHRPVRADAVPYLVDAHLSMETVGIQWSDHSSPAWTMNLILFSSSGDFVRALGPENLQDLTEIITGKEPTGMDHMRLSIRRTVRQPLAYLVFGGVA